MTGISVAADQAGDRTTLLKNRLLREWLVIALLASALIAGLSHWRVTSRFDNLIYDYSAQWLAPATNDTLAIVAIDEASLARRGRWPWTRDTHARLINQLAADGAVAIGFDVILSEPDDPSQDQLLSAALAQGPPTALPVEPVSPGSNGRMFDIIQPLPLFADAIAARGGVGHVMVVPDSDGVVRRMTPCLVADGQKWPHLAVALSKLGTSAPVRQGCGSALSSPQLMPMRPMQEMVVISYADVLDGRTPAELIKGRTVLVGATANGLGDQFPGGGGANGTIPGVALIANMMLALDGGGFITPVEGWRHLLLSLAPLWFLLIGLWRWTPGQVIRIASLLGLMALFFSVAALNQGYWFAPGATLAGLAFVYPLWGWRRLQATSDYMGDELSRMDAELKQIPLSAPALQASDVVADQTQRLSSAIAELRDLRRFVADALASLPDPMIVTGADWTIRIANPPAQHILGNQLEGSDLVEQLLLLAEPSQAAQMRSWLISAIEAGVYRDDRTGEDDPYFEFTARDGSTYAMRATALNTAGQGDAGDTTSPRGQIVYLADITELTDAQREREHVLQLLSHDMRAPLASILALVDRPDIALSDTQRNQRISVQTRRTMSLADNFVDLARMESTSFTPDELLLAEIVAEAADGLYPIASQKNVTISVDDRSEMGFVLGEGSSLLRAFTNLIDNALRYAPEATQITIVIEDARGLHSQLSVSISDQGTGIAPELLDRLFQRFAASQGSRASREGGIGLGLHYVASVMTRHGGRIEATNITDEGSDRPTGARFTAYLPLAPEPVES